MVTVDVDGHAVAVKLARLDGEVVNAAAGVRRRGGRRGRARSPGQGRARRRRSPPRRPAPRPTRRSADGPDRHRDRLRLDLPRRAAGQDVHRRAGAGHPLPAARWSGSASGWPSSCRPWSRSPPAVLATLLPDGAGPGASRCADLPGRRDRAVPRRRRAPTPPRRSRRRSSPPRPPRPAPAQGRGRVVPGALRRRVGRPVPAAHDQLRRRVRRPVSVFIGAWAALLVVSGLAVLAGRVLLRYLRLSTMHYVGAGVCLLLAAVTAYELSPEPAAGTRLRRHDARTRRRQRGRPAAHRDAAPPRHRAEAADARATTTSCCSTASPG